MKFFKTCLCTILVFIFATSLFFSGVYGKKVNAAQYYNIDNLNNYEEIETITTTDGVFIVGVTKGKAFIQMVFPEFRQKRLSFDNNILTYTYSNGVFYFLTLANNHHISSNSVGTIFYVNFFSQESNLNSFTINNVDDYKYGFAADNSGIYTVSNNNFYLEKYNYYGSLINRIKCNRQITQVLNVDNDIVVTTTNGTYYYKDNNNSFSLVSNFTPLTPCKYIGNKNIVDNNGNIFTCDSRFNKINSSTRFTSRNNTGITSKYIISFSNNRIIGASKSGKNDIADIKTNFSIDQLACFNNNIIPVSIKNGVKLGIISENELNIIVKETKPLPSIPQEPTANLTSPTSGTSENNKFILTSNVYNIGANIIKNVPSGTTFGAFKSNIYTNANKITFTNYKGEIRSSGNIGTNASVSFEKDKNYNYSFLIVGDLTGEGSINSRDKLALYNHLLDVEYLNDLYLVAADINYDSYINTKDLLLLSRQIN